MLLPSWALFIACNAIGMAGLVMAQKKPWAVARAFISVFCVAGTKIVQLRDPLSLTPQNRLVTETWSYVAVLFWSCVVGLVLPVVGLYLRSRSRGSHTAGR
jgi:hypothetical protein